MKVYIGIDWSENKHDVCMMHETGEVLRVQQIPHTIAGFRQNGAASSRPPAGNADR